MEFKKVKLQDVVTILGDGIHGTPKYSENGEYYFINGNNLVNGKIIIKSDTKTVDYEEYKKYKKELNNRTLLVSINGTLGNVAVYNDEKCILGKSACYFNVKDNVNKQYIQYILYSKEFKKYIQDYATGTTIKNMSLKAMREFEFMLPRIEVQNKIAKVLSCIDKKIELNNQINDNLLEFIKKLYIETFKDEQNKKKIKEVVEFSQGVQVPIENQSEKYDNGLKRFIRIVDLTQGGKDNIRYIENKDRGIVDYDDVFMIRYGSPGILGWNYKGIIANNLFKINPKTDETTKNYLFCYFNDDEIQTYIKQNATSSTMPAINFSLLYDRLIAIPNKEKLLEFDRVIETIRLKSLELSEENKRLDNLRDILLPKLMNGAINLDKIEV